MPYNIARRFFFKGEKEKNPLLVVGQNELTEDHCGNEWNLQAKGKMYHA